MGELLDGCSLVVVGDAADARPFGIDPFSVMADEGVSRWFGGDETVSEVDGTAAGSSSSVRSSARVAASANSTFSFNLFCSNGSSARPITLNVSASKVSASTSGSSNVSGHSLSTEEKTFVRSVEGERPTILNETDDRIR